jgi:hypothetical protein
LLTQPRPDISKAICRCHQDDAKRTFDVIKSIRAIFGKGSGTISVLALTIWLRAASVMDGVGWLKVSLVLG